MAGVKAQKQFNTKYANYSISLIIVTCRQVVEDMV